MEGQNAFGRDFHLSIRKKGLLTPLEMPLRVLGCPTGWPWKHRRRQLQRLRTAAYVALCTSRRLYVLCGHHGRARAAGHQCRRPSQLLTAAGGQQHGARASSDTRRNSVAIRFASVRREPQISAGMCRRGLAARSGQHRKGHGHFTTGCESRRCQVPRPHGGAQGPSLSWPKHHRPRPASQRLSWRVWRRYRID